MFSDKAKSVFDKVKALFTEAPAAPVTPAFSSKVYKTADGTEVTVEQAGDVPAAGEKVMIAGAPATAGTWALEDGSSLVTDESGLVVSYTEAAPAEPVVPEMDMAKRCEALESRIGLLEAELEKLRQPVTQMAGMESAFSKQDEKLTAMVEFFDELIKQPTAAPITAPENRRTKFLTEKEKADERMRRMGEAIKEIKHN